AFLSQCVLQGIDGRIDQIGAVVDRHDLDRFRQAGCDFLEPPLDVLDHIEGVHPETLQDYTAGDFSLAIELGDAAPFVRAELDPGDIPQQYRCPAVVLEHDVAEIVDALQITFAADHIFELGQLNRAAAHIGVAGADRVANLRHGD